MEASAVTVTAPQPPPEQLDAAAILAALTVLLLSDLPTDRIVEGAKALLAPLGLAVEAIEAAVLLAAGSALFIPSGGPAVRHLARTASPRRAAYLVAAAKRLDAGRRDGTPTVALRAERRYLAQHLAAERTRAEAARRIDRAAAQWGPTLGWFAKGDSRTTLECARAHGADFSALRPPAIGWPGTLHGGACRCRPGPPWNSGRRLPE